jgi:dTDP-4-dehydrorhamnose reductase
MKIALFGAAGQLGQALLQSPLAQQYQITGYSREQLDISDEPALRATLSALQPDLIINAAAYTAVDAAESDDLVARAANATGPKQLARWAAENRVNGVRPWLLQISTDFVFSGRNHRAWLPDDQPDPLSIYGRTKLEGELHVRYLARDNSLVLRTSWVYSRYGHNFLNTMLRLMREKDALNVVDDQISAPSSTTGLVRCISAALVIRPVGTLHWRDAGVASRYDFAVAIQDEALRLGLLDRQIPIHPIPSSGYPTPARRPAFSLLDTSATNALLDCHPQHWRRELVAVLTQIKAGA